MFDARHRLALVPGLALADWCALAPLLHVSEALGLAGGAAGKGTVVGSRAVPGRRGRAASKTPFPPALIVLAPLRPLAIAVIPVAARRFERRRTRALLATMHRPVEIDAGLVRQPLSQLVAQAAAGNFHHLPLFDLA